MDVVNDSIVFPILAVIAGAAIGVLFAMLCRGGRQGLLLASGSGGAILCLALWFGYTDALDYTASAQQRAERRDLDRRTELLQETGGPGAALACLNGLAGAAVENACARAVFATPEATALAVGHAATRLSLLADSLAYAKRFDPKYEATTADLRRSVENDAFGIYAHVLAARDGCTANRCDAFALLRRPDTIKAHLQQQTYEHRVAENSLRWHRAVVATAAPPPPVPAPPEPAPLAPVAAAQPPVPSTPAWAQIMPPLATTSSSTTAVGSHGIVPPAESVLPNIAFPSSDSIPPISIMSPEPRTANAAEPPADQNKPAAAPAPVPVPRTAPRAQPQPQQ